MLAYGRDFTSDGEEVTDNDRQTDNLPILTRTQLANLPPVQPLILDTLDRRSLAVLAGYWGTGKSFVSLDWACCVATGKHWQDRDVASPRVGANGLYISR